MPETEILVQRNLMSIVRPSSNQWQTLRDLKIRSIIQDPIAFADPVPERTKYEKRSQDEWMAVLSGKMSGGRPGESIVLFAQDGNKYVGLITAIIPQQSGDKQVATVQHTFVDKDHRGKGLGEDLLKTLIEQLKLKDNIASVQLDVVTTQIAAMALYKKLGFQIVGLTKEKAKRGDQEYDRYDMVLNLR